MWTAKLYVDTCSHLCSLGKRGKEKMGWPELVLVVNWNCDSRPCLAYGFLNEECLLSCCFFCYFFFRGVLLFMSFLRSSIGSSGGCHSRHSLPLHPPPTTTPAGQVGPIILFSFVVVVRLSVVFAHRNAPTYTYRHIYVFAYTTIFSHWSPGVLGGRREKNGIWLVRVAAECTKGS